MLYYLVIFFIIGTVMGSFYNVVGLRLPNKESLIYPGSKCPNCNHKLKWFELIPIFSFVFLKGKCRMCHQKISIFYPIIEFITGLLFSVSYYAFGFSYDLLISLVLVSMFSIIIVSDLNFYIIPDSVTIVASLLIIIIKIFQVGFPNMLITLGNGLLLFALMYGLMLLGNIIFKKESLGGGDVKLMFPLGMILPMPLSLIALFISSLTAIFPAIILYFAKKDKMLPFGPFLIFGTLALFLSKIDINTILQLIN